MTDKVENRDKEKDVNASSNNNNDVSEQAVSSEINDSMLQSPQVHAESSQSATAEELNVLNKGIKKALDSSTRSTLFSIGSFMVALYSVYLIAELDAKTDAIYTEARSTMTALSPIALDKNAEKALESREIYPTDPRVMSIASTLLLRGVSLSDAKQYLEDVELEVAIDSREQYFFKTMAAYGSPLTMVNRTGDKEITLFDKWKISFASPAAPLLEQFPMNPTLVMNHESVAFPECVEGAEPYIAYAKATIDGETWEDEPSVLKDEKLGRWIFTFNDIEPLDNTAFNRRILAVPNCRLTETTKTEKSE
ncbi:hypothetical protein WE348_20070 (plasmid) [Alteromonas macleodii]|uniref:hypothetical protein n=1 Tax=Alteromonas macleodii TaxID=28108 RepID=UPI0030D45FDF